MAYAGNLALVRLGGTPVAVASGATTMTGSNTIFYVTDRDKRIIARTASVTLYEATTAVATALCTVDRIYGSVTLTAAHTGAMTITYEYVPTTTVAAAREWSANLATEMLPATQFQDTQIRRAAGLKSMTGSFNQIDLTDSALVSATMTGNPVLLELFANAVVSAGSVVWTATGTLQPTRVWALLNTDEMKVAVAGLAEETVGFESDDTFGFY